MKWIIATVTVFAVLFIGMALWSNRDHDADGRESTAFFALLSLIAVCVDGALIVAWVLFRMFTT